MLRVLAISILLLHFSYAAIYTGAIRFKLIDNSGASSPSVMSDITNSAIMFFQQMIRVSNTLNSGITYSTYSCTDCDYLLVINNSASDATKTILQVTDSDVQQFQITAVVDFYSLVGSSLENYQYHRFVRQMIHCIMKVMAFKTLIVDSNKKVNSQYKNLQAAFNQYYSSCKSINDYIEAIQVSPSPFYYWDAAYLYQDIMTVNFQVDEKVFSIFDIALLKDISWFSFVDSSFAEHITTPNQCPNISCNANNMFCPSSSIDTICNVQGTSKSKCTLLTTDSTTKPSCMVLQPITGGNCYDSSQNEDATQKNLVQTTGSFEYWSYQSGCFQSDVQLIEKTGYSLPYRCQKYSCDKDYNIKIYFDTSLNGNVEGEDIITCTVADQGTSKIQNDFKYYSLNGLSCPQDNEAYCAKKPVLCKNHCSKKGVCIKGSCSCVLGSYGDDCSCTGSTSYQEGGKCVASCSFKKAGNSKTHICADKCAVNEYYDTSLKKCNACVPNCLTCWNANTKCDSCQPGFTLFSDYTCIQNPTTKCSTGKFFSTASNSCQSCDQNCQSCFKSSSYCLSCNNQYFLNSQNTCQSCPKDCVTCTSADLCTKCSDLTFLTSKKNQCSSSCLSSELIYDGACVSACPAKHFVESKVCYPCNPICDTCETSANFCMTCDYFSKLIGHFCTNQCNDEYAYVRTGLISNAWKFQCQSCSSIKKCQNCVNTINKCTSCSAEFFLYKNTCVQSCPTGYLTNQQTNECDKCDSTCKTCSVSSYFCLSCADNLYMQDNKCKASCPSDYNQDSSTMTCTKIIPVADQKTFQDMMYFYPLILLWIAYFVV